jgi:putative ABC transport system permease protein
MVIGTGGGIGSYESQVRQSAREWYSAPLYVTAPGRTAYQSDQPLTGELRSALEAVDGVRAAHPMRFAMIRYADEPVLIYAFPLVEAALTGDEITRGIGISQADLAEGLTPTSVVLSRRASQQLGRDVGDAIVIPLRHRQHFQVSGLFNDLGNINTLYMEYDTYRRASDDTLVDRFAILLDERTNTSEVAYQLKRLVEDQELPADVQTGAQMAEVVVDSIRPIFAMARAIQIASLLVALLVVVTTMLATVFERRVEFALQRALGLPSRMLGRTITLESFAIGIIGAIVAIVGGLVIAMLVKLPIEIEIGWTVPYSPPFGLAAVTIVSITILTVLASVVPARRAARTPIAEVLREE